MSSPEPAVPAPSRPPVVPEGSSEDGYPSLILGRRSRQDVRLIRFAAVFAVLAIVFLFLGVPALLNLYPAPIIHISDVYYAPAADCTVYFDFILTNSGARDGTAVVGMAVNGVPYTNWSIFVRAHSYRFSGPSIFVPQCNFNSYDVAILSVTAA